MSLSVSTHTGCLARAFSAKTLFDIPESAISDERPREDAMAQDAKAATSWPLFRSLAAYRPAFLPSDLIAGLTLAAIAIPEQMATARLGGFEPQIGFFA